MDLSGQTPPIARPYDKSKCIGETRPVVMSTINNSGLVGRAGVSQNYRAGRARLGAEINIRRNGLKMCDQSSHAESGFGGLVM